MSLARPPRIFYAHDRWMPDDVVVDGCAKILARAQLKGFPDARVFSGRDDFNANIEAAKPSGEAWKFWAERWGAGVRVGGVPRYDWIVVPDNAGRPRCGMAVVHGLRAALRMSKPVFYWHRPSDTWARVVDVVLEEPIDAQAGWELRCRA